MDGPEEEQMGRAERLTRELRAVKEIGIVNYKRTQELCGEAADLIEEMEERIAIMMESDDRERAVEEALGEIRI